MPNEPIIIIAGLADAAHVADLQRMADHVQRTIVLAAPPVEASGRLPGTNALDFTSHLEWEPVIEACRNVAKQGDLALFREHQLRHEGTAEVVRALGLRCIALDADVGYDDDPAWVTSRIESLQKSVAVEAYAIDLFTDVAASWDFFQETRPDELGPADIREIGERFPLVLSADLNEANVRQVMSFPTLRGLLMTCNEVEPWYPAHRHVMPYELIRSVLRVIWNL
ncbi:Hypothetical protein A7982_10845 [Minicystis rosea]|nr:Hypothetical protein A7982_10845 [Minicystis rosea]